MLIHALEALNYYNNYTIFFIFNSNVPFAWLFAPLSGLWTSCSMCLVGNLKRKRAVLVSCWRYSSTTQKQLNDHIRSHLLLFKYLILQLDAKIVLVESGIEVNVSMEVNESVLEPSLQPWPSLASHLWWGSSLHSTCRKPPLYTLGF